MNEMIALAAGLLLAGFVLYAAYKRAYERQIGRALHGRPVRVHLPEMRTVMRAYLMLCVIVGSAFVIVKADEHYDAARYACAGEEGDQGVFTAEEIRAKIASYYEENAGTITMRTDRDDPYLDLIVLQNEENDAYMMILQANDQMKVEDDHVYRIVLGDEALDYTWTFWGSELGEGFGIVVNRTVHERRCNVLEQQLRIMEYGSDPEDVYVDHTVTVSAEREVDQR